MNWRPIDTFDFDKDFHREVLICGGTYEYDDYGSETALEHTTTASWSRDRKQWGGRYNEDGFEYTYKPTHWMPRPAPFDPSKPPAQSDLDDAVRLMRELCPAGRCFCHYRTDGVKCDCCNGRAFLARMEGK